MRELFPPTSPPEVVGNLNVSVAARTVVEAGDYLVSFVARTVGVNSNGNLAGNEADIF